MSTRLSGYGVSIRRVRCTYPVNGTVRISGRDRERERWNSAMQYVWNVCEPTKTFRVHNMVVIDEDRVIEADIEFWLGGVWHNLAVSLVNDEMARPLQQDGTTWDPGWQELRLGER